MRKCERLLHGVQQAQRNVSKGMERTTTEVVSRCSVYTGITRTDQLLVGQAVDSTTTRSALVSILEMAYPRSAMFLALTGNEAAKDQEKENQSSRHEP